MITLTKDIFNESTAEVVELKSAILTLRKLLVPEERATLTDENLALFKTIYHQHERRVRSTLIRLVGKESYEDLAQETFFRVWKNLSTLKNADSLSSWIYKITLNVAYDEIKKTIKERNKLPNESANTITHHVEEFSKHYEYKVIIEKALKNLSFDQRSVLVMHDLEGITEKEISDILDIPVGTVKSRLFYARDQMRTFLKKEGISHYEG